MVADGGEDPGVLHPVGAAREVGADVGVEEEGRAIGGLMAAESRSTLAAAVREGKPWPFWLAVKPPAEPGAGILVFLAVYHPARRALDLVFVPRERRRSAPEDPVAAALQELAADPPGPEAPEASLHEEPSAWPEGEPPSAARAWLIGEAQGLSFWSGLALRTARGGASPGMGLAYRILLALELHRLAPGAVRPAWLPEGGERKAFLSRILSEAPPEGARPSPITVEVFNSSDRKGVASRATKVLRWKGADVVGTGNVAPGAAKTTVYDRTGRFESAAAVREMLGCPSAEAVTRVDRRRLVEVTVVLAGDCDPGDAPGGP